MKTLTLKISDDYFDKIVSFLEILPKKAIIIEQIIEQKSEEKKLKEIEKDILCAVDDIKYGNTKHIKTIS